MAATYLRDGRAPVPKDPRTSAMMSRIRSKDTGPERMLRRALRQLGLTGYRLHPAAVPGRPDVCFIGTRVAVFVHGCYWHGCPHCALAPPRSNRPWWRAKIAANRARDARKAAALRRAGWRVVTVWECRLRQDPGLQARRVAKVLLRPAR